MGGQGLQQQTFVGRIVGNEERGHSQIVPGQARARADFQPSALGLH